MRSRLAETQAIKWNPNSVQMSTSTHTFLIIANQQDAIPFKGSHGAGVGGVYI